MKYLIAVILLSLTACASVNPNNLIEVDEHIVLRKKCLFLGKFDGYGSLWYFDMKSRLAGAKNEIIEKAIEMEATHIKWGQVQMHNGGVFLTGRAYKCN
jgi:hypothetical protein